MGIKDDVIKISILITGSKYINTYCFKKCYGSKIDERFLLLHTPDEPSIDKESTNRRRRNIRMIGNKNKKDTNKRDVSDREDTR